MKMTHIWSCSCGFSGRQWARGPARGQSPCVPNCSRSYTQQEHAPLIAVTNRIEHSLLERLRPSTCLLPFAEHRHVHNSPQLPYILTRINAFVILLSSFGPPLSVRNRDVLCFLWGTKRIYICYVDESSLVVRVPGYWTEIYCVSCEVRTEYIYIYIYVM
jgi:hypothetical protein